MSFTHAWYDEILSSGQLNATYSLELQDMPASVMQLVAADNSGYATWDAFDNNSVEFLTAANHLAGGSTLVPSAPLVTLPPDSAAANPSSGTLCIVTLSPKEAFEPPTCSPKLTSVPAASVGPLVPLASIGRSEERLSDYEFPERIQPAIDDGDITLDQVEKLRLDDTWTGFLHDGTWLVKPVAGTFTMADGSVVTLTQNDLQLIYDDEPYALKHLVKTYGRPARVDIDYRVYLPGRGFDTAKSAQVDAYAQTVFEENLSAQGVDGAYFTSYRSQVDSLRAQIVTVGDELNALYAEQAQYQPGSAEWNSYLPQIQQKQDELSALHAQQRALDNDYIYKTSEAMAFSSRDSYFHWSRPNSPFSSDPDYVPDREGIVEKAGDMSVAELGYNYDMVIVRETTVMSDRPDITWTVFTRNHSRTVTSKELELYVSNASTMSHGVVPSLAYILAVRVGSTLVEALALNRAVRFGAAAWAFPFWDIGSESLHADAVTPVESEVVGVSPKSPRELLYEFQAIVSTYDYFLCRHVDRIGYEMRPVAWDILHVWYENDNGYAYTDTFVSGLYTGVTFHTPASLAKIFPLLPHRLAQSRMVVFPIGLDSAVDKGGTFARGQGTYAFPLDPEKIVITEPFMEGAMATG